MSWRCMYSSVQAFNTQCCATDGKLPWFYPPEKRKQYRLLTNVLKSAHLEEPLVRLLVHCTCAEGADYFESQVT